MKNYQLLEIKENWNELKALSGGKGYYLPMVKNIKRIDIELEAINLIKEKTKEFQSFIDEKEALLKKYAKVDEHNNPIKTIEIVEGTQYYKYDIEESDKLKLEEEGKELVNKYEDVLKKMAEKEQLFIDTMNAACTISFNKIKECDLPSVMTPEQVELIYDFIEFE